jgi:hypothetical protein
MVSNKVAVVCVWVPLWCQAASQCNSKQSRRSCVGMGASVVPGRILVGVCAGA